MVNCNTCGQLLQLGGVVYEYVHVMWEWDALVRYDKQNAPVRPDKTNVHYYIVHYGKHTASGPAHF